MAAAATELAGTVREVQGKVAAEVAVSLTGHPRLVDMDARGLVGQGDDKAVARTRQEEDGGGVHPRLSLLFLFLWIFPDTCVFWCCHLADQTVQDFMNKVETGVTPTDVHGCYTGQ